MIKDAYFLWRTGNAKALTGFTQSDCTVVEKGKPKAYISVLADDAPAIRAANDLSDSIEKMTGCKLPFEPFENSVPIFIGRSAAEASGGSPLDDEGFALAVGEKAVFAFGNDTGDFYGTEFAVTAILEALGFGFFGPDELWNVVPKSDTAVIPGANLTSRPDFCCRRNRVLEQYEKLGKRWGLGGVKSEVEHKYGHFFPPHIYEKDHPEYYALSGGTRSTKDKKWWELCLSNDRVAEGMAEQVCEFFDEHPDWKGLSIGQNDGNGIQDSIDFANWCECDHCREFAPTYSDAVLRFSNKVATLVYKKHPEHTLMFYGYFGTYPAPVSKCPEPISPNLQLTLCKECGFTGSIRSGESCFDKEHPPFAENFAKWKSQGLKHIAIYEWNCPGAANPAWKEAFWVQGEIALDNLRWFFENGVDFVYFDQGPNDSYERKKNTFCLRWPQWYCTAYGSYNTGLHFEDIMRDACERLYGNAADRMFEFYGVLADANAHCRYPHFNWGLPLVKEIYDAEYIERAEKALENAESTSGLDEAQRERIVSQRAEWEKTKKMARIQ